jgi:hypothetical protein
VAKVRDAAFEMLSLLVAGYADARRIHPDSESWPQGSRNAKIRDLLKRLEES